MYRYEVQVASDPKWYGNSVTYDTREDAIEAAKSKFHSWPLTVSWRVLEVCTLSKEDKVIAER